MLQSQFVARRQKGADLADVVVVEQGHHGGAEGERAGIGRGQGEDALHVAPGGLFRDLSAGQRRILGPRPLHVHVEFPGQTVLEQHLDHVGEHAVGVQLHGQAELAEVAEHGGQAVADRGLAARDHDAVQPLGALGDVFLHEPAREDRHPLGTPGDVGIVAGRAEKIAAAQKQDAGGVPRPVAQTEMLETPQPIPGTAHASSPLFVPARNKQIHTPTPPGVEPWRPGLVPCNILNKL